MRSLAALMALGLALSVCLPSASLAGKNRGYSYKVKKYKAKKLKRAKPRRVEPENVRCIGCQRDKYGRIRRDPHARRDFMRLHPCPSTGRSKGKCPGYVVDHIVPLKRGGIDHPSNMQWQTVADAKAKDKIE